MQWDFLPFPLSHKEILLELQYGGCISILAVAGYFAFEIKKPLIQFRSLQLISLSLVSAQTNSSMSHLIVTSI